MIPRSAAARHLVMTSILAGSVVATLAWLSPIDLRIRLPWWRAAIAAPVTGLAKSTETVARDAVPAADMVRSEREAAIFSIWLFGVALTICRVGGQSVIVRAIARRATSTPHAEWLAISRDVSSRLEIDRPVALRISAEIDIPFVTGMRRPLIVLPAGAAEWTAEHWRSVIAHEMAHVARGDVWSRAIAQTACALHWFNPLVWWLAAAAGRAAECAADDLAIRSGIRPSTYAETLVTIAAQLSMRSPISALGFAQASSLESRVRAVLDADRPRAPIGVCHRAVALNGSAAIAALVGCIRLAPTMETVASRVRLPSTAGEAAPVVARSQAAARRESPVIAMPRRAPDAGLRGGRDDASWVDDAVVGLVALLDDPSPQVRATATRSLRRFAADPRSRTTVARALRSAGASEGLDAEPK